MGTDAGQILLDTDLAAIKAASTSKPAGRMVQTVAQTGIANNTITAMSFTTEDLDTDNAHNTVTNNTRVTPTRAGWYRVHGSVAFTGQTDYTALEALIRTGGSLSLPPAGRMQPSATSTTLLVPCTALVFCNGSSDYFELCYRAVRSGAGTSSTVVSVQFATVLEWVYERES